MKKNIFSFASLISFFLLLGLSVRIWNLSNELIESRLKLETYKKYEESLLLNASSYIISNDPLGMFQEILSADARYNLALSIPKEELCDVARGLKDKKIIDLLNKSKLRYHNHHMTCFLLVE